MREKINTFLFILIIFLMYFSLELFRSLNYHIYIIILCCPQSSQYSFHYPMMYLMNNFHLIFKFGDIYGKILVHISPELKLSQYFLQMLSLTFSHVYDYNFHYQYYYLCHSIILFSVGTTMLYELFKSVKETAYRNITTTSGKTRG